MAGKAMSKRKTGKGEAKYPKILSAHEWQAAHDKLLRKEKAATHASDALAAKRRRLRMVRIDKDYVFDGEGGPASLLDLIEGRSQLILYHFMFAPGVHGWPSAGCPGCSMFADNVGRFALVHLHVRDTSLVLVSRAPIENILRYKARMGWTIPWYSLSKSEFNEDFGLTTEKVETFGLSVFLRKGNRAFRTYFTAGRGVETLGTAWTFLDLTPLGRQEDWEDSPKGRPQTPALNWWRRHDEY